MVSSACHICVSPGRCEEELVEAADMDALLIAVSLTILQFVVSEPLNHIGIITNTIKVKQSFILPLTSVLAVSRKNKLRCYAECMQENECIAVNVYSPVHGVCECHQLTAAATNFIDLEKRINAAYMGPGNIFLHEHYQKMKYAKHSC